MPINTNDKIIIIGITFPVLHTILNLSFVKTITVTNKQIAIRRKIILITFSPIYLLTFYIPKYVFFENLFLQALSFVATIVAANATNAPPATAAFNANAPPIPGIVKSKPAIVATNAPPAAAIHAISETVPESVKYAPTGIPHIFFKPLYLND